MVLLKGLILFCGMVWPAIIALYLMPAPLFVAGLLVSIAGLLGFAINLVADHKITKGINHGI